MFFLTRVADTAHLHRGLRPRLGHAQLQRRVDNSEQNAEKTVISRLHEKTK